MYELQDQILTIKDGSKVAYEDTNWRNNIHTVIFEGSVEIGEGAFACLTCITQLTIAKELTISEHAFGACTPC